MVKIIAEEKNLPEETVLDIIQMAIAAAWRRDNGEKDMDVRAVLNINNGTAEVFVSREVIEDDVAYNPATEIPLKEAKKLDKNTKLGDKIEEKYTVESFGRVAAQFNASASPSATLSSPSLKINSAPS